MSSALLLSLQTTAAAFVLLLLVGVPLGYWLARFNFPGKLLVDSAVNLPLVLPPTVVGYALLVLLGRSGWLGADLAFTWTAAAVASAVMGLPLTVNAARIGFASVDRRLENAARTLGIDPWRVFWRVTLPLAKRGVVAGLLLGTLRALGEFGATLLVAGNIPGRTQTMPLAIYDAVQRSDYQSANLMAAVMIGLAFVGLAIVRTIERSPSAVGR
jgi:molybdate transport system permease protein